MNRCAEASQYGDDSATKKAMVAKETQTMADRLRIAHVLGQINRYHAQMSAMATATRMKPRYAMKGPSIVSHVPPRPMMDSPIGNTQHEADNNARSAAIGMTSRAATPDSVADC
ncbi:hypothetical protein [uncultured Tateyamaria sp.]|uniref:hypothetical protein n=1 Tax=uncultured Tateyamaria sp. TaxID=455651 RepID=UPI002602E804|nr:hypothetical protein [uncultured Tateyamaria sp.]